MYKAYEYRIYPSSQQIDLLQKEIGLCRLYWNTCLGVKKDNHNEKLYTYKECFSKFKPEALQWIIEVDTVVFNWERVRIANAFKNFFGSIKKKGKKFKEPKFKSKKNPRDSITYTSCQFKNGKLWVSRKLGSFDGAFHCQFAQGELKNCTIKRTATGKWFVKICVDKKEEKKCENGKYIGIDWNCKDDSFLTMSDGTKVKCPRFLKRKEIRLAKLQRKQSKLYKKGAEIQTKNYEKSKFQVAKFHEKVAWQRKDWLHKLSRELANNYEFVVVEDINLQSMAQMFHGKAVGDQGFGMLRSFISYKTNLVKVPAAYTSQTCSICGNRKSDLTLNDREWDCLSCGSHHDRDINAAINIMASGISRKGTIRNTNACEEPRSSMKQESPKSSAKRIQDLEKEKNLLRGKLGGISPVFSG